jgi:hypothetical protein
MMFFPKFLVPLLSSKAKKVDFPIRFSTVEKFTMPCCYSCYLPSLVITKVMMAFAVDTTVVVQALLYYAVTAILPAVRPAMFLPEQVQSVINADDKEGHKALSQHPIQNAFVDSESSTQVYISRC